MQFQPTNKTNPIVIIYQQNFYHLSKYVNKIERIYLQEHKLTDDSGWILNHEMNSSYWGLDSISGETYFNGEEHDLFNEGSSSRAYSFNLYLNPGIIHYKRGYKKLYKIFSDNYPISYIIFFILKSISLFLKKVESNKKIIELLFEIFKDKPNDFEENMKRIKEKNSLKNKKTNINNNKIVDKSFMRRKSVDASLIFQKYGNSSRLINNTLKISNVVKTNLHNINNNINNNNLNNNNIILNAPKIFNRNDEIVKINNNTSILNFPGFVNDSSGKKLNCNKNNNSSNNRSINSNNKYLKQRDNNNYDFDNNFVEDKFMNKFKINPVNNIKSILNPSIHIDDQEKENTNILTQNATKTNSILSLQKKNILSLEDKTDNFDSKNINNFKNSNNYNINLNKDFSQVNKNNHINFNINSNSSINNNQDDDFHRQKKLLMNELHNWSNYGEESNEDD